MPKPPFPPPHGGGPRKKMKISEITDIIYLTGNDIEFYKTEGELLVTTSSDIHERSQFRNASDKHPLHPVHRCYRLQPSSTECSEVV